VRCFSQPRLPAARRPPAAPAALLLAGCLLGRPSGLCCTRQQLPLKVQKPRPLLLSAASLPTALQCRWSLQDTAKTRCSAGPRGEVSRRIRRPARASPLCHRAPPSSTSKPQRQLVSSPARQLASSPASQLASWPAGMFAPRRKRRRRWRGGECYRNSCTVLTTLVGRAHRFLPLFLPICFCTPCCCVRARPDCVLVPFDLVTEHVHFRALAVVTFR
jgi:hypothetical protein